MPTYFCRSVTLNKTELMWFIMFKYDAEQQFLLSKITFAITIQKQSYGSFKCFSPNCCLACSTGYNLTNIQYEKSKTYRKL
jgi:hypothetical protein